MPAPDLIMIAVVVAGLSLLVYHHIAYPVILSRLARNRQQPSPARPNAAPPPTITMVVPAYNEEAHIEEKIRNIASLAYPPGRFRAVIALDGPTDETRPRAVSTAQTHDASALLSIVEYERNIGKIAVLNDQIERTSSDIVALTDTSAILPQDALMKAAAHFQDPSIGFVAAGYRLVAPGSEGERAYMRQLAQVRRDEAILDSPLGAHGALYFFRRPLFQPFERDTINDDFILPMRIVEQGYRGVYDETIDTIEIETSGRHQEFRRRVRIGAGNLQQMMRLLPGLSRSRPWILFMFLSGKGARPLMPLVGLVVLLATAALAWRGSAIGGAILAIEVSALVLGTCAVAMRGRPMPRVMEWIGYLVEGHAASALGAAKLLAGTGISGWQRRDENSQPTSMILWPRSTASDCPSTRSHRREA